jgi:hypothetical protein
MVTYLIGLISGVCLMMAVSLLASYVFMRKSPMIRRMFNSARMANKQIKIQRKLARQADSAGD